MKIDKTVFFCYILHNMDTRARRKQGLEITSVPHVKGLDRSSSPELCGDEARKRNFQLLQESSSLFDGKSTGEIQIALMRARTELPHHIRQFFLTAQRETLDTIARNQGVICEAIQSRDPVVLAEALQCVSLNMVSLSKAASNVRMSEVQTTLRAELIHMAAGESVLYVSTKLAEKAGLRDDAPLPAQTVAQVCDSLHRQAKRFKPNSAEAKMLYSVADLFIHRAAQYTAAIDPQAEIEGTVSNSQRINYAEARADMHECMSADMASRMLIQRYRGNIEHYFPDNISGRAIMPGHTLLDIAQKGLIGNEYPEEAKRLLRRLISAATTQTSYIENFFAAAIRGHIRKAGIPEKKVAREKKRYAVLLSDAVGDFMDAEELKRGILARLEGDTDVRKHTVIAQTQQIENAEGKKDVYVQNGVEVFSATIFGEIELEATQLDNIHALCDGYESDLAQFAHFPIREGSPIHVGHNMQLSIFPHGKKTPAARCVFTYGNTTTTVYISEQGKARVDRIIPEQAILGAYALSAIHRITVNPLSRSASGTDYSPSVTQIGNNTVIVSAERKRDRRKPGGKALVTTREGKTLLVTGIAHAYIKEQMVPLSRMIRDRVVTRHWEELVSLCGDEGAEKIRKILLSKNSHRHPMSEFLLRNVHVQETIPDELTRIRLARAFDEEFIEMQEFLLSSEQWENTQKVMQGYTIARGNGSRLLLADKEQWDKVFGDPAAAVREGLTRKLEDMGLALGRTDQSLLLDAACQLPPNPTFSRTATVVPANLSKHAAIEILEGSGNSMRTVEGSRVLSGGNPFEAIYNILHNNQS